MSMLVNYGVVVIGGGPAGFGAALEAARAGVRVALVESDLALGGASVRRRALPIKALQQRALEATLLHRVGTVDVSRDLATLEPQVTAIVDKTAKRWGERLARHWVDRFHARARFISDRVVELQTLDGARRRIAADQTIIATGSHPQSVPGIAVDDEHIMDIDSILSMRYLPDSIAVLGNDLMALQYASLLAALGVRVSLVNRANQPSFLDAEVWRMFLRAFKQRGGRHLTNAVITEALWDGCGSVRMRLGSGEELVAARLLVANGNTARLDGLQIEAANLRRTPAGWLQVDEHGRSSVGHIYGVGSVTGSMPLPAHAGIQGERVVRHALGKQLAAPPIIPVGLHSVPEMSSVGQTEAEATANFGSSTVGRANLAETSYGEAVGLEAGMLKLVTDAGGSRLVGVHAIGHGATELIHLGHTAVQNGVTIEALAHQTYDFPVLAEAYQTAALEIEKKTKVAAMVTGAPAIP